MDKEANFAEHLNKFSLGKLQERIAELLTLAREDSLQEVLVFKESDLNVLTVHICEDWILHLSLLNVDRSIREHQIKSVLVGLVRLIARSFSLQVTNLENS